MGLGFLGYLVANLFWQYLTGGDWLAGVTPSLSAYQQALLTPLTDIFHRPLGIINYPWMIVVVGLLLSVLIFTPLLTSIICRLWAAMALVLIVALVGRAPILALTLALGCIFAARTRLRNDFPFLALLVGLIPVGIYLYVFSMAGGDSATPLPIQRWIPYAPTAVALLVPCLVAAAVLPLVRLTGWKMGIIAPAVLTVLLGPLLAFYLKVGPAELDYAVITAGISGNCAIFEPVVLETWRSANADAADTPGDLRDAIAKDLRQRQQEVAGRCDRFIAEHPTSVRAPAVLWIKAQCQSLQIDEPALWAGMIKYVESYPLEESRPTWQALAADHGRSSQAALARWKLAELTLRQGDMTGAIEHLRKASAAMATMPGPEARAAGSERTAVFTPRPPIPDAAYYERAKIDVSRLIWMMEANDVLTDAASARAMTAYLSVNPYQYTYSSQLGALLENPAYRDSKMGNNIRLAVARAASNLDDKVQMLERIARDSRDTDAVAEANFELGRLAMQWPGAAKQMRSPREYFDRVIAMDRAGTTNPWRLQAAKWLAASQPTTKPK